MRGQERRSLTRRGFVRLAGAAAFGIAGLRDGARRAAGAATPKRGGTLKVLQIEPAVGFNPALEGTNWPEVLRMVYNGLTDFSPASVVVPGLAKSWTVSEAADTFTFQLHQGVAFHDGTELTSEDVKFTYEMFVDPKVGSALASFLANLKSVETAGRYAVVFKFDGPNPLMLPSISALGILPKHLWAGSDPRRNKHLAMPIGTGPFVLKEWRRSDYLTFTANRNYFRKPRPFVDQVIFKVVADAATGIEAFKNGELDAVFAKGMPGGLPYAQVGQIIRSKPENIVANEFGQNLVQYLWMNCAQPPFDNVKVRRALAHAINKELIIRTLLQGFGKVQDSIIGDLPGLKWAHDPTIKAYEYSPARANQLLDEAGYPKKAGTRFAITILATEGFRVKLSEAIKAMLAPLGIEASIKSYTWAPYSERITARRDTAGALWTVFISRQMDPAHVADYLSARNIKPGGTNSAQWSHAQATELIESARGTANPERRKVLYQQLQRIVHDEVPLIPLYSPTGVDLWHRSVEGLHSIDTMTGTMQFVEEAWLNR
jgi:peptide/nickel transport system substrate-binding protein